MPMSNNKKSVEILREINAKYSKLQKNWDTLSIAELVANENELLQFKNKLSSLNGINETVEKKLLNILLSQILSSIISVRTTYIKRIEETYDIKINPKTFLKNRAKKLKKSSISTCLTDNYINFKKNDAFVDNNFQDNLEEKYPEARKIKRHFIIHYGDTNTGKTYNSIEALKKAKKGVYLAPLRLLALEIFQKLNYDGVPCTLSTGEEEITVPFSNHISSTIEKVNLEDEYDVGVIDEAQLIGDASRGQAWTKSILGLRAKEIHICCSPNVVNLLEKIIISCNDTYETEECIRKTKLTFQDKLFCFPDDIEDGDALICFSRKNVLMYSKILNDIGINASVLYGKLPPDARRKQVELFENGTNKVIISTDAIGMGVNLSIRRVVFLETLKFNGVYQCPLTNSEIRQIAGRAGRMNKYEEGFYATAENLDLIKNAYLQPLPEIKSAYTLPTEEALMEFPTGTLTERLITWKNKPSKNYYSKADISEALTLLDDIKHSKFNLTVEEELKFIFIPFDIKDIELLKYWRECIEAYIYKEKIPRPYVKKNDLVDLKDYESYYRKLDLYFSMSKVLKEEINEEMLLLEKEEITKQITKYLLAKKHDNYKRCNICGARIPIDFKYNICNKCHSKLYLEKMNVKKTYF